MSGILWQPGGAPMAQSSEPLSAAQREQQRVQLVENVDWLLMACHELIKAQRVHEATQAELTASLAATNLSLSEALDRLDTVERGAAVFSTWVRRPLWQRVRARLGL